jgi:hypothetical protein
MTLYNIGLRGSFPEDLDGGPRRTTPVQNLSVKAVFALHAAFRSSWRTPNGFVSLCRTPQTAMTHYGRASVLINID